MLHHGFAGRRRERIVPRLAATRDGYVPSVFAGSSSIRVRSSQTSCRTSIPFRLPYRIPHHPFLVSCHCSSCAWFCLSPIFRRAIPSLPIPLFLVHIYARHALLTCVPHTIGSEYNTPLLLLQLLPHCSASPCWRLSCKRTTSATAPSVHLHRNKQ